MYYFVILQIRLIPITINYNLQRQHIRKYIISWILLTASLFIYSSIIYFNYYPIIPFLSLLSSYIISVGVFGVVISIYTFFLQNLRLRYKLLNQNLKYVINGTLGAMHKMSLQTLLNKLNKQAIGRYVWISFYLKQLCNALKGCL